MNRDATVLAIYEAALDLPADRRSAYVADRCGADVELRDAVNALVGAAERADEAGFLAEPFAAEDVRTRPSRRPASERLGARIGRYELLSVLGEGGFGTVFRARQLEPVQREVALKLIRGDHVGADVLRRFESERHLLARLQHPGIAQLLDADTTPDGAPYFVMELVDGVPVTDWHRNEHQSLRARLTIFAAICDALQYAHQKGVIHRDIKPSNVLVAECGGAPSAKVIDFGIAKLIGDSKDSATQTTRAGLLGSPEYMSPEQIAEPASVDTRSDVYGLGVLLYELLCEKRPFGGSDGNSGTDFTPCRRRRSAVAQLAM